MILLTYMRLLNDNKFDPIIFRILNSDLLLLLEPRASTQARVNNNYVTKTSTNDPHDANYQTIEKRETHHLHGSI